MRHNPTDPNPATHLGWRTGPSDAAQGMDHLVLGDAWNPSPVDLGKPLVEFVNPNPTVIQPREPESLALDDSPIEPASLLWSAELADDQLEASPLVVFGEDPDGDQDQAVFS